MESATEYRRIVSIKPVNCGKSFPMGSIDPAAEGEQGHRASGRKKRRNHAERQCFFIMPHQIRDSLSGEFSPAGVVPKYFISLS